MRKGTLLFWIVVIAVLLASVAGAWHRFGTLGFIDGN